MHGSSLVSTNIDPVGAGDPTPASPAAPATATAHSGIVDATLVHSSSLVSSGFAPAAAATPATAASTAPLSEQIGIMGVHHVAVIVEVGPDRYRPPRPPALFAPSLFELNGIL